MAEIAVKVIDPGGYQFAQLVDDRQPVRRVVPLFVERLGLPADLDYQLIPSATGRALLVDSTLAGAGVRAGAELVLRPVRDSVLSMFLDNMYEDAKKYVADKLWELAKRQLETIVRLDPAYPDRAGLRGAIAGNNQASPPTPPGDAPADAAPSQPTQNPAGCWVVVIIVVAAGLYYWKPWQTSDKKGGNANVAVNPQPGLQPPPGTQGAPPPQLGTGDVQITLRWQNAADLDLHVVTPLIEPNGQREQIWYSNRTNTRSGGRLDVDANSGCANLMRDPVENVFWPAGRAPRGEYQVYVNYFTACNGSGPTNYEVTIHRTGHPPETVRGQVQRPGERKLAASFRY